jgi:hypothetical protein
MSSLERWTAAESAPNYSSVRDARVGRIRDAYDPANYRRLATIKRAWDPDNMFRVNRNIPPAT